MPDVGVLQLKISADAGNAARSLKSLQDRLKAVKDAAANFNTQNVVDGITGIINTVKGDATVSNAVKNLASLLNAVAAFSKIKDIGLKEADINKLATLQTVANGFKLGTTGTQLNKLKEALGGEWNTDQADKARQALETLVGGAKSLEENGFKEKVSAAKDAVSQMTAGTAKEVKSVSNEMQNLGQATGRTAGILSSLNGASSMNPFGRLPQAFYSMQGTSLNETKSFVNQSVQQWRDQAEEAKAATKAVETAQGSGDAVTSLARGLKELNNSVKGADMARFADGIKALNSALAKGANSYLTLGRLAGSIKKLKESVQGFKLPSFTGLENLAKSLQENFNAENGLKRIAEGILAVKEAGAGFKAPKVVISTNDSSSSGFATTSERVVEAAQAATESISDMKVATVEATEAVNNQGTVNLASEFAETKETVVETRVAVDDMIDSEKTAAETMAEISRAAKDVQSNTVDSGFGTEGAQSFDGMAESAERTTEAIARYNEAMEFARQWNAKKPPQEMSNIETARRLVEEFTAIANTSDKISDLTTKLGFVINDYDKEIEKAEPSEKRLNALQLQIDSLVKQIDTLNSKSIRLDFARELTPENLGELSELDRLEQKRSDLVMTLHEEMEANKLSVAQIMTRAGQIDTLTEKIEKLRAKEEEEQTARLSVRETNEMAQRVNQLDMLIAKSEEAKEAYNALINDPNATNSEQIAAALKINKAELEIQRYNELQGLLANVSPEIQKFAQDQLNAGVSASTLRSKLFDLDGELKQKKTDMKGAADGTKSLGQRFKELMFGTEGLNKSVKKMFPSISGLLGRFKQLVKYRVLRAIIKQISDGFREGYENYYYYSKAIGSGFAPAMDSATSSLLQMKNSIGAAVAPLMQSLVPVLQTVVNWFIEVVNYANQFLALMRGQSTWSRSTYKNVNAFDETKKAAKGAGSAIKDLLADWDELNIIQSEGGGSGTETSDNKMADALEMFEEVDHFNDNIKRATDYIKENMDNIKRLAVEAGAAILGWKISNAFNGVLGKIGGVLGTLATVALTVELTDQFGKIYTKTGDAGWLIADALTGAVGATIAGTMAKKIAGGGAGLATAGATLTISGLVNLNNAISAAAQGERARYQMLSILSAVESGIGTALIAKGIGLTTAFSFGLGAAAAAGAVAISVGALIQLSKDDIEWGENTLTAEEARAFVEGEMFTGLDVTATIDKVNTDLSNAKIQKKEVADGLAALIPPINTIRLGIDKEESYNELKKQLFGDEESGTKGIIEKMQDLARTNVQELETAFAVVPVIDGSGKDVSGQYLASGISGWSEVQNYMNWLGGELGKELSKGFTEDGIAKFDEDAVREMTDKIRKIGEIITGSQAQSAAQSTLRLGLADLALGDLDQSSVNQVVELFGNYQSQLREAYEGIYKDAASQYLVLSNYYREQGNEELAKTYMSQYRELIAMLPMSVDNAVKNASAPGMEMIYEFLHQKFEDVFTKLALNLEGGGSGILKQLLVSKFVPTDGDIEKTKKDFNDALLQIYGGENIFLSGLMSKVPGINVTDLITFGMDDEKKKETIENLEAFISGLYGPEVAQMLIGEITDGINNADVSGAVAETVSESVANGMEDAASATESAAPDIEYDVEVVEDQSLNTPITAPAVDTSSFNSSLNDMWLYTKQTISKIATYMNTLNGMTVEVETAVTGNGYNAKWAIPGRASGGYVRSGDLVMANENGNFEMMGKMGRQPVVANNDQIVTGITRGVESGNDGIVSALNTLINLAQRIERKEIVAKAVPSSAWGQNNQRSAEQYSRVTGG